MLLEGIPSVPQSVFLVKVVDRAVQTDYLEQEAVPHSTTQYQIKEVVALLNLPVVSFTADVRYFNETALESNDDCEDDYLKSYATDTGD